MPRLTSGKIDRKALKAMPLSAPPAGSAAGDSDLPETPAEAALFAALATLFPGQPILRTADFFTDLGGHSFFAARLASALRADPPSPTSPCATSTSSAIGKIAGAGRRAAAARRAGGRLDAAPAWRAGPAALAQAAAVPALVTLRMAQWLAPFFTYHFFTGEPGDSVARAIAASIGVFLLATVMEFAIAIAGKWLIAGRLRAGSYPLWGLTYYRWWLADRLVEAAPAYLLSGSSLYNWWLRALGAKVGREVIIGSMTLRAPDLLTSATTSASATPSISRTPASSAAACCSAGSRWRATPASAPSLSWKAIRAVGAPATWKASPRWATAARAGRAASGAARRRATWGPSTPRACRRGHRSRRARMGEGVFFVFGILLIVTLFFMPVFPSFVLIDWFDEAGCCRGCRATTCAPSWRATSCWPSPPAPC
jgi:hypothetical protein